MTLWRSASNKLKSLVRLACWKVLRPEIVLSSGVVAVKSDSDWVVANEIFVHRDYDEAIGQTYSAQKDRSLVRIVDLGANVGFFSQRCIDLYLQAKPQARLELVAVEGSPALFADLTERLPKNCDANVTLIARQGLIGQRSGKAMIYSSMANSCTNSVVRAGMKVSSNPLLNRHAEECPYLDLDQLIDPKADVDLLKCDIEGSELDFLQSYEDLLKRTRLLVMELHPLECDVKACRRLLEAYGFAPLRTIKSQPTHSLEMFQR